jgi:hypothetical protein
MKAILLTMFCVCGMVAGDVNAQRPDSGTKVVESPAVECETGFLRRRGRCVSLAKATPSEIRRLMIAASLASYPGNCPCPYNVDRAGRACGRRSAYSRPGGRSPLCYDSDISNAAVKEFREANKRGQPR